MKRRVPDFARSGWHTTRPSGGLAVSMNFMGLGEKTSSANCGRVPSALDASKM